MPHSKPCGKRSAYSFFLKALSDEYKSKNGPTSSVNFGEFTSQCAMKWKGMAVEEKSPFDQLALRDKLRYQEEMAEYKPMDAPKQKKKRAKDPDEPKKALSGFFIFSRDNRPKLREMNPDWSITDVARELGRQWGSVSEDVKNHYQSLSLRDRERYEREMNEFRNRSVASK